MEIYEVYCSGKVKHVLTDLTVDDQSKCTFDNDLTVYQLYTRAILIDQFVFWTTGRVQVD